MHTDVALEVENTAQVAVVFEGKLITPGIVSNLGNTPKYRPGLL